MSRCARGMAVPGDFLTAKFRENYPNSFNAETMIEYALPKPGDVSLAIYNILGQEVRRWDRPNATAGCPTIRWDRTDSLGSAVSTGIYFAVMQAKVPAGDILFRQTRKMLLLR